MRGEKLSLADIRIAGAETHHARTWEDRSLAYVAPVCTAWPSAALSDLKFILPGLLRSIWNHCLGAGREAGAVEILESVIQITCVLMRRHRAHPNSGCTSPFETKFLSLAYTIDKQAYNEAWYVCSNTIRWQHPRCQPARTRVVHDAFFLGNKWREFDGLSTVDS